MKKDVMIVTGAGQIGMAIARRTGFGKKIILGDKSIKNAETIAKIMNDAGYDVEPFEMDLSSRDSILAIIAKALEYGEIKFLVNAAGVSPSQAPIRTFCRSNHVDAIRLDTQQENKVMQHILDREGFEYCGLIQFDGGPKLAYEWDG